MKKFSLILFILLLFGCSVNNERFAILLSDKINYAVFYNTNYKLYVSFSKSQLIRYSSYFTEHNIEFSNLSLIEDLMGKKDVPFSYFEEVDERNIPIIDNKEINELEKIVKKDKVIFAATNHILNFKGFDREQLKKSLKIWLEQYKEKL